MKQYKFNAYYAGLYLDNWDLKAKIMVWFINIS